MKQQQVFSLLLVFVMVVMLNACQKTTVDTDMDRTTTSSSTLVVPPSSTLGITTTQKTYQLALYDHDVLYQEENGYLSGASVDLPILDSPDELFIGWSDGTELYYDTLEITGNTTLYAVYEVPSEVFSLTENLGSDPLTYRITGYTGSATHLVVPQVIDGKHITMIASNALSNSQLVFISLPIEAVIGMQAFGHNDSLEEVRFHGQFLLPFHDVIGGSEYRAIINENPACQMVSGSEEEGAWSFMEGCPIISVDEVEEINVNNAIYSSYSVTMDRNLVNDPRYFNFTQWSFDGATNLKTIEIPDSNTLIIGDYFHGCPALEHLIVSEDHPSLTLSDGVLYNKGMTELILYPNGLESESYTIPESVKSVRMDAFYENTTLKTIHFGALYTGDFTTVGLRALTAFVVDEENAVYRSIDGVLYAGDTLVHYPASKTTTTFTLPETVIDIGAGAFAFCQYLESVDLGHTLTFIGDQAFRDTVSLKRLDIPSSVLRIGMYMLDYSSVDTLYIHRSETIDGSITQLSVGFGRYDKDLIIYLPDDSIDAYSQAMFWSYYTDRFQILSDVV